MKKKLIVLFIIALLVRLIFLILAPDRPINLYDTPSWDAVATNLLASRGFIDANGQPTSTRPPLYPIFLAIIYFIFGKNFFVVTVVQAIVGSATVIFIYLIAKEIFNNEKLAILAAYACAIWPALVVYCGIIASEILFIFLSCIFIYILIKAKTNTDYILAGVFLGLSNLTRSTYSLYPIFLLIFVLLFKKENVSKVLIMFLFSILLVVPWTVRNYFAFKRFLFINTNAGELFWSGTYLPWDGICKHNRDENFYRLFPEENPVDRDNKMFKEGIKNIISNPLGCLKLTVKKFFRFWFKPVGQELVSKKYPSLGFLMYIVQVLLVLLFFYGCIKLHMENFLVFPIGVLLLYMCIMHNLLAPIPRYRLPIEPFIILFALYAVKDLFCIIKNEF